MANLDFSTVSFPTRLSLYDINGQAVSSIIQTTCGKVSESADIIQYQQQYYFPNNALYRDIVLDASNYNSSTNYGYEPLFTFANGVTIGLEYYGNVSGINVAIRGRLGLYNNDGTLIRRYQDNFTSLSDFQTGWQDQRIENFNILYYSPFYYYAAAPINIGDNCLYGVNYTGVCIGYKNQTIYQPEPLQGAVNTFTYSNYDRTREAYVGKDLIVFQDGWNDIYNEIVDNGDGTPIIPILPSEDTSGIGGGDSDADYNPFSDPIDFPELPSGGSAISSGFIRIYNPSNSQLNSLASELWSDDFIDEIKRIQNDPLEAIVSLHSVPFSIATGLSVQCHIGNYESNVTMDLVTAQYYVVNCGNISLPEHWASALDYAPYTQVEIYLPFVGVKPLQIDDIMDKVLNVKYNIDILTGAAICMLKCGDSVLYTYNTEVAQNIPFSASSHAQLYQSIISASGAVVGMMSGGAGAIVSGIQSAASVAASKHSQVSRGGSLGGTVGVLGDFVPYLIIHRPIQSLAADFAHKKGYPSNITANLSSLSGYTEVDTIHLEGVPCTDSERNELYNILKEGVIL